MAGQCVACRTCQCRVVRWQSRGHASGAGPELPSKGETHMSSTLEISHAQRTAGSVAMARRAIAAAQTLAEIGCGVADDRQLTLTAESGVV